MKRRAGQRTGCPDMVPAPHSPIRLSGRQPDPRPYAASHRRSPNPQTPEPGGRFASARPKPLPHARLHDLRHLHATTLLLAGVPVHVVAARLGHADPAVTLRVYSHVLREHAAGVGDIFAQAVKSQR